MYNYKINSQYMFSNYNEYYINSKIKNDNIYSSLRINQKLTKKSYINYVTSIDINDEESNLQTKKYKTYISYRKYIRRWLYYDIVPYIEWERDNNFNEKLGLKVNLGILISK